MRNAKPSTYFSRALNEILNQSYAGNKAALAKDSGIDRAVISILAKPGIAPSTTRLEAIAKALSKEDRVRLLLAAARDVIPPVYQSEVLEDGSTLRKSRLSDDLASVICFLEEEAHTDPETAALLRSIGRWTGVISSADD